MDRQPGDDAVSALVGQYRAIASPLRAFLRELSDKYRALRDGQLADYIPELSEIARVLREGDVERLNDGFRSCSSHSAWTTFSSTPILG